MFIIACIIAAIVCLVCAVLLIGACQCSAQLSQDESYTERPITQ